MIWTSSQLELRLFKCCIRRNFETGTLENIQILLACFRTNLLSLKITSWYRLIVFIILLKIKAFKIVSRYALNNAMYHGLRTPNGGINQKDLKRFQFCSEGYFLVPGVFWSFPWSISAHSEKLPKWHFLTPTWNLIFFGPNAIFEVLRKCHFMSQAPCKCLSKWINEIISKIPRRNQKIFLFRVPLNP